MHVTLTGKISSVKLVQFIFQIAEDDLLANVSQEFESQCCVKIIVMDKCFTYNVRQLLCLASYFCHCMCQTADATTCSPVHRYA